MNVTVQPELLIWARERASLDSDELARRVGTKVRPAPIAEWERTGVLPIKKLEQIAAKTHAPFGMLFLSSPPEEPIPIRDFRRNIDNQTRRPSLNLLETIYMCQYRQSWMSENLQNEKATEIDFIGSATVSSDITSLASTIRERLKIGSEERRVNRTAADATLWMMARLEEAGILMQRNGVVGNQTNRPLDRNEFKGFALADRYAPLIFINGKDWPASQMFTIAHECVHLWLGLSAVPDGDWYSTNNDPTERFCNQVAAEILMPANEVTALWKRMGTVREDIRRMIRTFHVSSLSLLIKVRSLGLISDDEFLRARSEEEREFESSEPSSQSSGGNYYYTAGTRLGKRFIREVLISTLEGKTSYSEAFDLLGTKKTEVFNGLVKQYLQEESK